MWCSYAVESRGLSGGILVLWRRGALRVDALHGCGQQVALVISDSGGRPWLLSGVYASTDHRERRVLWGEVSRLAGLCLPSLVAGDFNCVVGAHEKRGGRPFVEGVESREFKGFMSHNGLIDLGFSGPCFTWCNNRNGTARVWERLDRALGNADWANRFPTYQVRHLPRIASDHCPILIVTDSFPLPRGPFRFEKLWTVYPGARDLIREVWRLPVRGNATYRLTRRLELARRRLIGWKHAVVGDIFRRIEEIEDDIAELQRKEDQEEGLQDSDMRDLRSKLSLHHSLLRQQETYWRQRSRVQWLREGDRNTRFFHQATVLRRSSNRIRQLREGGGGVIDEDCEIRERIFQFFRSRWTEQGDPGSGWRAPGMEQRVSGEENESLTRPVGAEEIRRAVWDLGADKAPGPDGFPPFFFRQYWPIVGGEVVEAIQLVFGEGGIPADWKNTFITLVPKRPDASSPEHFRPISLCSTLYKVCAKVLVGRIKPVISHLICPEQGAFISGRSISDNTLLAQEFMHDLQHALPPRLSLMAIKLDMEWAYDRISWRFL